MQLSIHLFRCTCKNNDTNKEKKGTHRTHIKYFDASSKMNQIFRTFTREFFWILCKNRKKTEKNPTPEMTIKWKRLSSRLKSWTSLFIFFFCISRVPIKFSSGRICWFFMLIWRWKIFIISGRKKKSLSLDSVSAQFVFFPSLSLFYSLQTINFIIKRILNSVP